MQAVRNQVGRRDRWDKSRAVHAKKGDRNCESATEKL